MIDRQKALIAASAAVLVALLLISAGFVAGRAASDEDRPSTPLPPRSGNGLPAGPTGIENDVPVGFAQSQDGAVGAAVTWLPWLLSTPVDDNPAGLSAVLADGVEAPFGPDGPEVTRRVQFVPLGARASMDSDTEATVEVFGPALNGQLGADLTGEFLSVPVDLVWDEGEKDWRITRIQETDIVVDAPFTADDLAGFRVVRASGGSLGGTLIEDVPGE